MMHKEVVWVHVCVCPAYRSQIKTQIQIATKVLGKKQFPPWERFRENLNIREKTFLIKLNCGITAHHILLQGPLTLSKAKVPLSGL